MLGRKFASSLCKIKKRRVFEANALVNTFANRLSSVSASTKLQWSYMQGETSHPLIGVTVGQLLQQAAERLPDKESMIFYQSGHRRTFSQLLQECDQLAAGLMALGIKRGDRVGIWAPNCLEWILAQYATARAGMILVNINPAYQAFELKYALRKVGIKAVIAAEKFKTTDYYKILHEICPELDRCRPGHLDSRQIPTLTTLIMLSDMDYPGALKFSDVMEAGTNKDIQAVHNLQRLLQFDDPINIQFTSGTTGHPKGATLSHFNITNNAMFIGYRLDYHKRETRICLPVPLYHCFGMVIGSLASLVHGGTCVFPGPSFEPETSIRAAHEERCTALYGTPTMFIDMLQVPNLEQYDLTSLYTGVMAGAQCPMEIMKQTTQMLHVPQITIAYGTTENSPVTFQSYLDDTLDRRVSTIGRPHPLVEVKVVDEEGKVLPVGQPGELCTRGYCVMLNYWDDPEKTDEVILEDNWYKTGDIAILDEDGYGKIVGRIKDMIIRGGENIYPAEIEDFLHTHHQVADVQVVGVPDERLGEQVAAWIKLKEGETATAEDIKTFCRGQIAHFKIPYYVSIVEEFPMTVTGKVQKFKIREATVRMFNLNK